MPQQLAGAARDGGMVERSSKVIGHPGVFVLALQGRVVVLWKGLSVYGE